MRLILAGLAAAGVGVAGALVLGEYSFSGVVVLGSGLVLGLFVGEAAVAVYRRTDVRLALLCGAVSVGSMTWAAWIASGHDLSYLGPAGWTSIVLAGAAGFVRAWFRRGSGSPGEERAPAASPEEPTA